LHAKALPSGGLVGNNPKGSIAEGITLGMIVCLPGVAGEGLTVITLVFPTESTRPMKHLQLVKFPKLKSRLSGQEAVEIPLM
jgi:hypothetical protein